MKKIRSHKQITIKEINNQIDKANCLESMAASLIRHIKITDHWYFVIRKSLENGKTEIALNQLKQFFNESLENKVIY